MPSAMRRSRSSSLAAAMCVACMLPGSFAFACTVSSTTLSFGSINPISDGQRDSTSALTVSCPTSTAYTITLNAGFGTYDQRTMLSGSNVLNYNLYADAQRTRVWGDGSGMTVTVSGSADTSGTSHTVYGSVPRQPQAYPGVYSDTIVITVTY